MKPLVFDATPLIYPGKINLIEKIKHLPEDKYTTKSVCIEVVEIEKNIGSLNEMIRMGWRCSTELYGEIIKALN